MEEEKRFTCKTCQHFVQHYVIHEDGQYHLARCGHCTISYIRHRNPNSEACVRWIEHS